MIMAVGGHYTYQGVPLFNYIKDAWHLSRNHFDRVGHAFQGVVTFLFIREVFFRKNVVKKQWVSLIALGLAFALSASYELIEFVPVYLIKGDVENFLGLQGDRWDSLWDMFWALTGALLILIFFRKTHNRQIARIEKIKPTKNPA
jgi:putative membrane protein